MSSSVALYEALTAAPDDRTRARVIAEAFERLEERYPHLPDLATEGHVRESELRLQKDIEQVRADLRATELRLQVEIEQVRTDLRSTELRLQAEIEQIRADLRSTELRLKAEIEQVRAELKADIEQIRADLHTTELRLQKEIAHVKLDLLKWLVPLMFAQVAAIVALVKLL
jgi:multidrug efflux pump subunit AcrA (membrane-fusion protein)